MSTAPARRPPPAAPLTDPLSADVLAPAFASAPPLLKEPAITIKPAADKKDKPKKDKGPNKEEACRLAVEAADAAASDADEAEPALPALRRLRELAPPDKVLRRCVAAVLEHALHGPRGDAAALAGCVRVARSIKRAPAADLVRALVHAAHPHARLPRLLAAAVEHKLVALADVGAWCEAGAHHPLLLEVLQALAEGLGVERLAALCEESKLNVCAHVAPGGSAAAPDALEALEARGLAALVPQLRVQAQLARQLAAEPAPHALYRWIKANVEPAVRQNAAFVSTLVALVAAHVASAAGAGAAPDKAALEREKALLEAYAPLLTALLEGQPDLQLAAVYAVQVHAHQHRYPKGYPSFILRKTLKF